jgi:hypothetical protein
MTCRACGREGVLLDVIVPAHLSHTGRSRAKRVAVDACIAPIVDALNRSGYPTANSCCGHGRGPGSVILHDGSEVVLPPRTARKPPKP